MIATTAERSAWHTVRLLSDADARPANGVALFDPQRFALTLLAYDPELAARVWELSEGLVRLSL